MGRKYRDTVPFKGAPLVLMVCQNAVIKTVFLSNLTGKEDVTNNYDRVARMRKVYTAFLLPYSHRQGGRDQQLRQGCQNAKVLYMVFL